MPESAVRLTYTKRWCHKCKARQTMLRSYHPDANKTWFACTVCHHITSTWQGNK